MTGCIWLCPEGTAAHYTQAPDKPQVGPAGTLPVPARSHWFNQFFTTHHWTEEGSAVWPKQALLAATKESFFFCLIFFKVVFQGRFQLHRCFAGVGI